MKREIYRPGGFARKPKRGAEKMVTTWRFSSKKRKDQAEASKKPLT